MTPFRHPFLITLFLFTVCVLHAQDDIPTEIDSQVWHPFVHSFNALDAQTFNALHTPDVIRGGPWGLYLGKEYYDGNIQHMAQGKAEGEERKLALVFEHRVHREAVAYEVGYYRVVAIRDGAERTYYGQFHVVLKKIDGGWKIAQDWDASEIGGIEVGETLFQKHAESGIIE